MADVVRDVAAYQPRTAEHTVLYCVIDEHLETFSPPHDTRAGGRAID